MFDQNKPKRALAREFTQCATSLRPMTPGMGPLPIVGESPCGRGYKVRLPCKTEATIRKTAVEVILDEPPEVAA